jgi:hypothetical protein
VSGRQADAGWRVAAASVCGASHRKTGTPCQDAHSWRTPGGCFLVSAVCDGAGSARLSHLGSRTAAEAAVNAICDLIHEATPTTEAGWRSALDQARSEALTGVENLAATEKCSIHDLATTLLVAAATPEFTAALQIGDGAIVARDAAGKLDLLTRPDNGEYANETTFLTSSGAQPQLCVAGPYDGLALFSDGLQRLVLRFPSVEPHEPFFGPLFGFLDGAEQEAAQSELLAEFLSTPRVCALTDDDITIVAAKRRGSQCPPPQ